MTDRRIAMLRLLMRGLLGAAAGAVAVPGMVALIGLALTGVRWESLSDLALAAVVPGAAIGFFGGFLPGLRRHARAQSGR